MGKDRPCRYLQTGLWNSINNRPFTLLDTLFYKEPEVSHPPYFRIEVSGGRNGEIGIPVSTTLPTDSLVLTVFFILAVIVIAIFRRSWRYTRFMLRNYWNTPRSDAYVLRESIKESRYHWPLPLLSIGLTAGVIYIAMSYFLKWDVGSVYEFDPQCLNILGANLYAPNLIRLATITGIMLLGYIVKSLVQNIVNRFIFNSDSCKLWHITTQFHITMLGVLILPMFVAHTLLHLHPLNLITYTVIIFTLTKINGFIRTYTIFFSKKTNYFRYFLYLCALEIIPLAIIAGILTAIHSGNLRW